MPPTEKYGEGMPSNSMESLQLVPARKKSKATLTLSETGTSSAVGLSAILPPNSTRKQKRNARQKETSANMEEGLQDESCLLKPSSSSLVGKLVA